MWCRWVVGFTCTCVAAALIPLIAALALALGVLGCGFAGIHCAVIAYRYSSLTSGFLKMVNCHALHSVHTLPVL